MSPKSPDPRRGEVWIANMDPTVGAEIRKRRPVAVISTNAARGLALRTVVPFTTSDLVPAPWHVAVAASPRNGLDRDTHADAAQVRTLACERFARRLGRLSSEATDDIAMGVAMLIEFR
jgi:mRNA interferase MazF